jgi:hypothetical protein
LIVIDSPYRELLHPLVSYIEVAASQLDADQILSVVVPEFIPEHRAMNFLHNQTANILRRRLRTQEDVIVIDVPYHILPVDLVEEIRPDAVREPTTSANELIQEK